LTKVLYAVIADDSKMLMKLYYSIRVH